MRAARTLTVVGCHAGGEIGNVVTGGVLPPPGATVFEQMQALAGDDSLRRLLLREPRGSVAVHANLIVPATRPDSTGASTRIEAIGSHTTTPDCWSAAATTSGVSLRKSDAPVPVRM